MLAKVRKKILKVENKNILLPDYELSEFTEKKNKYLLCIPVLNEGEKFKNQLKKMADIGVTSIVDIIICDGGTKDGSIDEDFLTKNGVRTLVIRKSPGHLSDQLMLGYYYAVSEGYQGTITIDGNGKDGLEAIWDMVKKLEDGFDLVQGSRYIEGGVAINTPLSRELAIKLIHVPVINLLSGFKYTDTTNGFRGHSVRVFSDPRIQPFRYSSFPTYSLIHYLTVVVPQLGYRVTEIPVARIYPKGSVPTKISPFKGNLDLLKILFLLARKKYSPSPKDVTRFLWKE